MGEFGNFAKTQGILYAQVVNVLSLRIKVAGIVIFAAKLSIFSRKIYVSIKPMFHMK